MEEINTLRISDIIDKDNLIYQYMKYQSTQYDGYPDWNLAGALQTLSMICGRRVKLEMAQEIIYPNQYTFCIADSTTGRKTTGMKKAKGFMVALLLGNKKLPESFTPERLIEELSEHPEAYFFKDEASGFLASMQKSYMADMREFLTDIYDCSDYKRSLRTSKSDKKTDFNIINPFVNIWFMTTPDSFTKYATTLDVTSGWLVRFLFLVPTGQKNWMGFREKTEDDKKAFKELYDLWISRKKELETHKEILMKIRSEDWEYFNKWQKDTEERIIKTEDFLSKSLYGRLYIYAIKLAMLLTIGKSTLKFEGQYLYIERHELIAGIELVDKLFYPSVEKAMLKLEESDKMKIVNKVREIIKNYKIGEPVAKNLILIRSHKHKDEFNPAIDHLIETGEISILMDGGMSFIIRNV